ncbi:hypothetical protein M9H77_31306 [Catharanthus roseus]|uniref:Uncharacterized protein n=1 Tax=Catharanthus roseus TaxID=4058 RepID=A0ACC0A1S7_CATRO|nr:hypothetical protein M9H77_31306 [Catharanthus roseus]
MVRPSGRRGDADLGPVMDRTGRVEGCPITASSRGEAGSSTQPPVVPFRSRPPFQPHMSHTRVPYEPYGSTHPPSHPTDTVCDPYLHAPTVVRPRIPYKSAIQESILYDGREADERGDDDGDGGDDDGDDGDDDQDDGDDDGDKEQTVHVAPVAPASGSDRRPRHGKGKGLAGSFMWVMSKFAGSRNKRTEVARDVSAPTQKRKKVKASDWEQTEAAERGFNALEFHAVATSRQTSYSHQELVGWWSLLEVWIYLYFPMFTPPFRHSPEGCKPYIQMFPTIGYKNESKLLDIRLRLDMMTADEVRWILYRSQDVRDCWVSTWHGFIAYFDCVEP